MDHRAASDTSEKSETNTVVFKLEDDVLVICNNGEPFSIEGIESLMLPHYTSKSEREFRQSFKSKTINKQVEELLEKRRRNYLREQERIQSDYNTERTTVGEYHGREVLELLQNCIDAMSTDSVRSNDTIFQIGAKGLGFRSLLNWCERIMIYSSELSVSFGLEEAAAFKKSLGCNQKVSIFSAPMVIEPIELSYTTQIVLKLKKAVIEDVEAQLMQIDERSMVFLPKIEELVIQTDATERIFKKSEEDGEVFISASVDGINTDYLWRVFKQDRKTVVFKDIDDIEKEYSYGISVAFCEDYTDLESNCLYSYFKTKVEFPIGWLCHADFELRSDRNDIIQHPLNELILRELVSLVDSSTEKIARDSADSESAIKSVVPKKPFPADIAGFNFSEYYYENIGRKKILPTVNGDFISMAESPWMADVDCPALLAGDAFNNLLTISWDADVAEFIYEIARRDDIDVNISFNEIKDAINQVSDAWSPRECLIVFEWWRKTYGLDENALDHLPNLIALEGKKWADGSDRVHFKIGGIPAVPEWVQFSFLRADFQEAVVSFYSDDPGYFLHKLMQPEQRDERSIRSYVTLGGNTFFCYLDRSTIIARVNSSVGENWSRAKDFVIWLYENYSQDLEWTPRDDTAYCFPSKHKIVARPETLYFGDYYGNQLADILAMQDGQDELFHFAFKGEDKVDFVNFISKFKVRFTPKIEEKVFDGFDSPIPRCYQDALVSNITYPLKLDGGTVIADEHEMKSNVSLTSVTVKSYKNLDDILCRAKTADLFNWIMKDDFLKDSLIARYEKGGVYPLQVRRGSQKYSRYVHRGQVRNYIAHRFSNTAWIQIGEAKYAPNQIILDEKIGMQFAPRLVGKSPDSLFDSLPLEEYEINAIISNLGFVGDFTKIGSSFLYSILNELSEQDADPDGTLSRKIYLQIMKASGLREPDESCVERKRFFEDGKVYCFDGEFRRVQDVRYADKSFPERVRAGQHLIYLPKNRGAKKAEIWFGVKEFKPDLAILDFVESGYNQQFQTDLHELLKGLYVENNQHVTDEKRWRAVKNVQVTLASSAMMLSAGVESPCEKFECGKTNTGQYVLMIGYGEPDKFDEQLTGALFEIVKTVINIDDTALASSFRDLWKYPSGKLREALIQRNDDVNIWSEADSFFDGIAISFHDDVVVKNKALFEKCHKDNLEKFKRILYAKLSASHPDEQRTYLAQINAYMKIEPDQTLLQDELCDVISLLQSTPPANLLNEGDIDVDVYAVGKTTKQDLCNAFPKRTTELNSFLSGEYDSLLRFGNYDLIKTAFENHLQKLYEYENSAVTAVEIPKQPIVDNSSVSNLAPSPPKSHKNGASATSKGAYTDYLSRQTKNIKTGKLAERIVYDYLVGEYGYENVSWVSQYAKEENVNLDGSDGCGYDIEYSIDGTKYYIEVKTNSSRLPTVAFNLSTSERECAEDQDNYYIYMVSNPKEDSPRINSYAWVDVKSFVHTPTGYWVEFKLRETPT